MFNQLSRIRQPILWALIPFFLIVIFTRSDFIGDTGWYAGDIAAYQGSRLPALLWEPGHLLWRPLGLIFDRALGNASPYLGEPVTKAAFVLVAISFVCSIVVILMFHAMGLRIGLPIWLSLILATSFFGFYAILEYSRSGTAYVPGLMCVLLSLWFTLNAVNGEGESRQAVAAGFALGFAVLLWAPNIVSSFGIAAAALCWNHDGTNLSTVRRMKLMTCIATTSMATIVTAYSVALLQLHISSAAELHMWLATSTHGWSQTSQLVRMVSGLPRSFISLGYGGIALKRYLFHDPYASVTLTTLVFRHLWKIGLFYLFAGCLIWSLIRTSTGRQLLCILFAGVLPVLFVALFILESGAPERYICIYPFLCLSVAYALKGVPRKDPAALAILLFLVITCLVNFNDLSFSSVAHKKQNAVERLAALQGKLKPGSLVALVTQTDDIYEFDQTALFDPLHRKQPLSVYDVIKVATDRVVTWRRDFAVRANHNLANGQSTWVSKRLLADKPQASWRWTEGDDRRIAWKDLKPFFVNIEYTEDVGGDDGFLLVLNSPHNVRFFDTATASK